MALFIDLGEPTIRFRFAARKALAAVAWMLTQEDRLDFHTILKAVYFADKEHLNEHGRPVFGANYRAMTYGPVPLEVYEMLKQEPYWLSELERDDYPWTRSGHFVRASVSYDNISEAEHLSETDWDAIKAGYAKSSRMTFTQRTAETHGRDWQKANLGAMDYADMLAEEHPNRAELIEDLRQNGRRIVL